jgi:hypothetical protein
VWKIQSELTAVYILMIKKKVIKEITNKIKKKKKSLPLSLCRPERDGVPMTYLGAGSQP